VFCDLLYKHFLCKYPLKELEKELELQIGMKMEMEIAMKLLEKDTHEKQDTLVALRQQLEEVKAINLQMFHKVQVGSSFVSMLQPGFLLLSICCLLVSCHPCRMN
jgi:hypothetical protein